MSVLHATAAELVSSLKAGDVKSVDVTAAFLGRIDNADEAVGAYLRVTADTAMSRAEEIDKRRSCGETLGLLAGLPIAVKDVLCTKGEPTTCASRMLENFIPPYDATVIARLRQADAVILGKTNMDEFAMGSTTENSALQQTRNPWDVKRVPGGSSGGSAACLAASMAPLAIGTDTGGSIRQPAAYCGVVGLKPTYGRVSRFGLVAFASSLDQVGPMARTAEDAALLLEAIAGHDAMDSTSIDAPAPRYTESIDRPFDNLRIGIVKEHFGEGLDPQVDAAVREAIRVYESLGATVKEVSLPHSKYAIATYYIIAPCEASSNLARYDGVHYGHRCDEKEMLAQLTQQRKELETTGNEAALDELDTPLVRMYRTTRSEGFGAEVKRRIMLGAYALSAGYYDAYYLKALKVRRLIWQDYQAAFGEVDVIAGPVTPSPAYKIGEKVDDPLSMYLGDLYTVSANLAGIAAVSIPCGFSETSLPIALQLQAPPLKEERLLRAAHLFQKETDWHTRRPALP